MPYSAVTQPRAWPLSQGGRRSSSVAVTSTWVSPNFTKHEPSAYFTTPRSSDTARSSSDCRRLGRIEFPPSRLFGYRATFLRGFPHVEMRFAGENEAIRSGFGLERAEWGPVATPPPQGADLRLPPPRDKCE